MNPTKPQPKKKSFDPNKVSEKAILDPVQEKKRIALNNRNKNNQRLKLGLSKKNWKRLKKFEKEYKAKIEKTVVDFYAAFVGANLKDFEGEEATKLFSQYDSLWRNWARYSVNKLGLHTRNGRLEVFNNFENYIKKQMKNTAKRKPAATASGKTTLRGSLTGRKTIISDFRIMKDVITLALKMGVRQKDVDLSGCKEFADGIKFLKGLIPRGGKTSFEKEAKAMIKKKS